MPIYKLQPDMYPVGLANGRKILPPYLPLMLVGTSSYPHIHGYHFYAPGKMTLGMAVNFSLDQVNGFILLDNNTKIIAATGSTGSPPARIINRLSREFSLGDSIFSNTLSNTAGTDVAITSDEDFIAISTSSTNNATRLQTFKKNIGTGLYDPLATVDIGPNSACNGLAISPDDTHLAVAHTSTPFVSIYRILDSQFTKIANPAVLPAGRGDDVDYYGEFLAVAHNNSPGLTIYERDNETYSVCTVDQEIGGNAICCKFSPSGDYLAVGTAAAAARLQLFKRTLNEFSRVSVPNDTTTTVRGITWDPSSTYLFVASDLPDIQVYERIGDTLTLIEDAIDVKQILGGSGGSGWPYGLLFIPGN